MASRSLPCCRHGLTPVRFLLRLSLFMLLNPDFQTYAKAKWRRRR